MGLKIPPLCQWTPPAHFLDDKFLLKKQGLKLNSAFLKFYDVQRINYTLDFVLTDHSCSSHPY